MAIDRNEMTLDDVRWFLNKNDALWGTMFAETIGEIAEINRSPWAEIWLVADNEMEDWRQDAK